jgi:hypothetical protein
MCNASINNNAENINIFTFPFLLGIKEMSVAVDKGFDCSIRCGFVKGEGQ